MADRFRTVYNTGDSPSVVDQEGHAIGGGEWGTIDFREHAAKDLLHDNTLVEVERPEGGSINPDAQAAFDATDAANANDDKPDNKHDDKPDDKHEKKKTPDDTESSGNKAATAAKKGKE